MLLSKGRRGAILACVAPFRVAGAEASHPNSIVAASSATGPFMPFLFAQITTSAMGRELPVSYGWKAVVDSGKIGKHA